MIDKLLTPEQAQSLPLSKWPFRRYGQIAAELTSLQAESGVYIQGLSMEKPFFRTTLVVAARGVANAVESGRSEIYLPNEFDYEKLNRIGEVV